MLSEANGICTCNNTNFRNILSKRSHTQKGTHRMILFICLPRTNRDSIRNWLLQLGRKREDGWERSTTKFSGMMEMVSIFFGWLDTHGYTKWEIFIELNT